MNTSRCLKLAALTPLIFSAAAHAQYSFTKIAESSTDFFGLPAINSSGLVAFERTNGLNFSTGIYTGTGGPLTTIASSATAGLAGVVTHPSINDSGVVAFKADKTNGDQGIYKGSGGALTLIDTVPAALASGDARLSINSSGQVAYFKFTSGVASAIYSGNGIGPAAPVVSAPGGTYANLGSIGTLQMSNSGEVAFYAQPTAGGQGVFSSTGPTFAMGADTSIVSFNDVGRAVFTVISGGQTLYTGPAGGPAVPYLDTSGPFAGFVSASINNSNNLAFMAALDNAVVGIFSGPNPITNKVIQTGDSLFGSTVMNANLWSEGLSDNGDIAFAYALADGRQGIAVAHVPAPGTVIPTLLLVGAAGCVRRRRA